MVKSKKCLISNWRIRRIMQKRWWLGGYPTWTKWWNHWIHLKDLTVTLVHHNLRPPNIIFHQSGGRITVRQGDNHEAKWDEPHTSVLKTNATSFVSPVQAEQAALPDSATYCRLRQYEIQNNPTMHYYIIHFLFFKFIYSLKLLIFLHNGNMFYDFWNKIKYLHI